MRAYAFVLSAMSASALIGGLALSSTSVLAQQSDPESQASNASNVQEEITVVAPRILRTKVRGLVAGGFGYYDMLTLTHEVSYADLNLAHPGDAKTLKDRITMVANDICQRLASMPPTEQKSQECVHNAVQSAMPDVDAAIAAAKQ